MSIRLKASLVAATLGLCAQLSDAQQITPPQPAYFIDAEESTTLFVVDFIDGSSISILTSDLPRVINKTGHLTLATKDFSVDYPWESVDKFSFYKELSTSLDYISTSNPEIVSVGSALVFRNFSPGEHIILTSVSGIIIDKYIIDNEGQSTISIDDLKGNVYIFICQGKSFKLIKN